MQVIDSGDSNFFIGEIVNVGHFKEENKKLLLENKKPAYAISQIFGLDEAPGRSSSFLSAASFQDTKKILTNAAVKGQVDYLLGVKENVILGNLIPVGTGLKRSKEITDKGEEFYKLEY